MARDGKDLQEFVNDYKILVWQSRKKHQKGVKKPRRNRNGEGKRRLTRIVNDYNISVQ